MTDRATWREPCHPRHRTEMAQLRALLEAWRQEGFDDAYDYVRAAELMIAKERAFYDRLKASARKRTRPPWRVRLAYRLLARPTAPFPVIFNCRPGKEEDELDAAS